MPIALTTGTPGSGKTLYSVSVPLQALLKQVLPYKDLKLPRSLYVNGVPGLLLDHEVVDGPPGGEVDWEEYEDVWSATERKPYTPPVTHYREVVMKAKKGERVVREPLRFALGEEIPPDVEPVPKAFDNWWLWCKPGDALFLDECQRLFPPAAAGRKLPRYISRLARHRHYGIDFEIVTQHPNLLHSFVRGLVGKHRHVRRLFGRGAAMVYEWDHATNPDKLSGAAKQVWRYDKSAYKLYKSAEAHTKQSFSLGGSLVVGAIAAVALPFLFYAAYSRLTRNTQGAVDASNESTAAGPAVAAASGAAGSGQGGGASGASQVVAEAPPALPSFPVYQPEPAQPREPYHGRAFVLDGSYSGRAGVVAYFGVFLAGERIATVSLAQLVRAGYVWTDQGPCAGLLVFGTTQRLVSCGAPARPASPAPAERPASGAAA